MKTYNKIVFGFILIMGLIILDTHEAQAKAKLRLSVQYKMEMGQSGAIHIKAKAKGDDGLVAASELKLDIYRLINDSSVSVGSVVTDAEGLAVFYISEDKTNFIDTSGYYYYLITAEGDKQYSSAEKELNFKKCILKAELQNIDSINYISVQLTDAMSGEPIVEEGILIGVERLFNQLLIGEMEYTDEDGMILVPYEDDIPSLNKELIFRITLSESETYGTVITRIISDLGVQSEMQSTFNERTMWSPPNKTPWILLIIPNLIILGIWFLIFKLIYTLYKISTLKNN